MKGRREKEKLKIYLLWRKKENVKENMNNDVGYKAGFTPA